MNETSLTSTSVQAVGGARSVAKNDQTVRDASIVTYSAYGQMVVAPTDGGDGIKVLHM